MSSKAVPIGMIARKATQLKAIDSYDAKEPDAASARLGRNLSEQGFAGGLRCCSAHVWNHHAFRLPPCIPSRKAAVAAMWDLFRASLSRCV